MSLIAVDSAPALQIFPIPLQPRLLSDWDSPGAFVYLKWSRTGQGSAAAASGSYLEMGITG